jgi:hypothetical protein
MVNPFSRGSIQQSHPIFKIVLQTLSCSLCPITTCYHDCNPSIDAFHLPLTFSLHLLYCMYVIRSAKVEILMNNNFDLRLLLDPPLWDRTKMQCIVMRTFVLFPMSFGWAMSSPQICFLQVLVMVQFECSCIFVIRTCFPSPHAGGPSRGVPCKNGVLLSIVRLLSAWGDPLLDDHLFIKPPVEAVT